jgi:hypothetical protein
LGDTVRTGFPAPSGVDAVCPFRGPGGVSSVPTGVTAGSDIPSWTYCTLRRLDRRTRSWLVRVSPPPASALALANLAPAVLPRAAALLHPLECHRHPSLGFRRPSGSDRKSAAVPSASGPCRRGPSHGVSLPSAVTSAEKSGLIPGIPTSPAVPSRLPGMSTGAAPGFAAFRALLLPQIRILFPGSVPLRVLVPAGSRSSAPRV